jgi:hypothetical protein
MTKILKKKTILTWIGDKKGCISDCRIFCSAKTICWWKLRVKSYELLLVRSFLTLDIVYRRMR